MSGKFETGRPLRERVTNHRYAIKHGACGVDTPVATHFNKHTHTMRVSVLQGASADVLRRRILERQWIQRIRNQGALVVINRDDGIDVATLVAFHTCSS